MAFCVKVEDALKYKMNEEDVREVRKTMRKYIDQMPEKELTVLYLKYIPTKGHGVGPLMPNLLNKVYGAHP